MTDKEGRRFSAENLNANRSVLEEIATSFLVLQKVWLNDRRTSTQMVR